MPRRDDAAAEAYRLSADLGSAAFRFEGSDGSVLDDVYMFCLPEKRDERGNQRAGRNAGSERIVNEAARACGGLDPATDWRSIPDMPMEAAAALMPMRFGVGGMAKRDLAQMRLRQRNDAAGTAVAGGKTGYGFYRGDLGLERNQRIELELLLGIPFVRHVRHQRAEQTAARTLPKFACIGEQGIDSKALGVNRRPQPHDAAACNQQADRQLTRGEGRTIGFMHDRD